MGVDGGIVTRYQILEHPTEHGQALEAMTHQQALFEHPPNLVTADRGVHSPETEEQLKAAGVKRVAIPVMGQVSEERQALQRTRPWRRAYRWRAGIEGRIADITGKTGWSGGWAWGSLEVSCAAWRGPKEHKAHPLVNSTSVSPPACYTLPSQATLFISHRILVLVGCASIGPR